MPCNLQRDNSSKVTSKIMKNNGYHRFLVTDCSDEKDGQGTIYVNDVTEKLWG